MQPPQQFFDELEPFREKLAWAQAGLGTDKQISQGKMMLEDFREFFGKWRPLIAGHPELRRMLDGVSKKMNTMERNMHRVFWSHLNVVVMERKVWLAAEASLDMTVAITVLRREMPETLREGFEKILSSHSFDAEKQFRQDEREIAEAEAKFRRALACLEIDWPERVDAAMRERLEKLEMAAADEWQVEIGVQIEKLDEKN